MAAKELMYENNENYSILSILAECFIENSYPI
jgi:hypothetical protein